MLDRLPKEIMYKMWSYLSPEEILELVVTFKQNHQITKDDQLWKNELWKNKLKLHFPDEYATLSQSNTNWYAEFTNVYRQEYRGLPFKVRKIFSYIKERSLDGLKGLTIDPIEFTFQSSRARMPAHIAAGLGYVEIITELHRLGANLTTPDNNGQTPVFIAAYRGNVAAIITLRVLGAYLEKPDNNGKTPAFIAAENDQTSVLAELRCLDRGLRLESYWGYLNTFFNGNYPRVSEQTAIAQRESVCCIL